ncbi:guanylate kinase [Basidiobolus ranarum]|uniref:guanylate kinase n=1 Tax=Basidiobolus ranarum TaxID=34480 RepID=A0ABR2VV57_9FUNG
MSIFASLLRRQVRTYSTRPIVVSGPSGSGKSTLLTKLFAEYPEKFGFSVSHTTRQPRSGEIPGKSYHFIDREKMEEEIRKEKFIEHAEFSGNLYGTSLDSIQEVLKSGKLCVLDIDMQGVKSVKKSNLNARFVFISPPSLESLEKRLRARGTENESSLKSRLDAAGGELDYAKLPGSHDIIIVNDELDTAYSKLKEFVFTDDSSTKH